MYPITIVIILWGEILLIRSTQNNQLCIYIVLFKVDILIIRTTENKQLGIMLSQDIPKNGQISLPPKKIVNKQAKKRRRNKYLFLTFDIESPTTSDTHVLIFLHPDSSKVHLFYSSMGPTLNFNEMLLFCSLLICSPT